MLQSRRGMLSRLGMMIFLQEFIYATWLVSLGLMLSKYGLSSIIGMAYALSGIAAILSPVFVGMLADRFIPSQIALAVSNLIGGVLLWLIPDQIYEGNGTAFLVLIFIYNLIFLPSFSLRNNISFRNIKDSKKDFPIVSVFGTVGFMAAGLTVGTLGFSDNPIAFQIGAVISILTGLYNFTLPKTPPLAKGKAISIRDLLCMEALTLLKDRNYLVFILCTSVIFIPFSAYNAYTSVFLGAVGFNKVSSVLTIGQGAEIIVMLLLPLFFARLGYKRVFLIGIAAWVLRAGLFAIGASESIVLFMYIAIALHGFCYNFFFIAGFMYTDDKAGPEIKGQAQGLLTLVSQGFGMFIGSVATGYLFNHTVTGQGLIGLQQWSIFWMYPMILAAITGVVFYIFFKEKRTTALEVEYVKGKRFSESL